MNFDSYTGQHVNLVTCYKIVCLCYFDFYFIVRGSFNFLFGFIILIAFY